MTTLRDDLETLQRFYISNPDSLLLCFAVDKAIENRDRRFRLKAFIQGLIAPHPTLECASGVQADEVPKDVARKARLRWMAMLMENVPDATEKASDWFYKRSLEYVPRETTFT